MIEERKIRKYPRLKVYHLAKYRLVSSPQEDLITASLKDIGGGGTCLRSKERLPVSSVLQLHINFPQLSTAIPVLAKVIWTKRLKKINIYELGIEFIEIEDVFRDVIIKRIDFVKRKSAEEAKE